MKAFFEGIKGFSDLVKTAIFVLLWVVVDGIVIRLLVGILRALGKLVGLLGDNAVARFLLGLPDTTLPLTSFIWGIIGPWVILVVVAFLLFRLINWWLKHPVESKRIGDAARGAGRTAKGTWESRRSRGSSQEDEWEPFERLEPRERRGLCIRIGGRKFRIGRK